MRGAPRLLAAAALLPAACGGGAMRELQGYTAIYCFLLSAAFYYPCYSIYYTRGWTGRGGGEREVRGTARLLAAAAVAAALLRAACAGGWRGSSRALPLSTATYYL